MLTKQDLALLRAALKFFREEMSPFDPQLLRHYFDRPADAQLSPGAVDRLQTLLKDCELRYLVCDETGTRPVDEKLIRSTNAALASAKSHGGRPATVILSAEP